MGTKNKNKKLTLCNGEPSAPSLQRPLSAVAGYYVLTEFWGHDVVPLQNLSYTAFIINSTTHTYTQVHKKQNKKKSCYKKPHPLTFTL